MMQAGEFAPTAHGQLMYNEAFRANQFVGVGVRPIYRFNQMFHVRGEFYGFMPIFPIERNITEKLFHVLNIWEKYRLFVSCRSGRFLLM